MAGIELIDEIVPKNNQTFVLVDDFHLRGGYRVVSDDTERDALALDGKQKTGAVVYVQTSADAGGLSEYYQWDGAAWVVWSIGSGGGITGPTPVIDNTIVRYDGITGNIIDESSWTISDSGDMQMQNDAVLLPPADGQGEIGTGATRFRKIYAQEIETGDLVMREPKRDACWRFVEHRDFIEVRNEITGKNYRLALEPVEDSE